jgi:DNA processing protein
MEPKHALVALNMVPGIGSVKLNRLIGKFESAENAFTAGLGELMSVEGIGEETARIIEAFNEKSLEKELTDTRDKNIRIVTIYDEEYPENLKAIHDPPPVLYIAGKDPFGADLDVAVIGTRMSTEYGVMAVKKILSQMRASEFTFNIISGLATGIDTAAHREALNNGISTIGVLGFGFNQLFSQKNPVAIKMLEKATIVSEFPMAMIASKQTFPRRNRIISGLSDCVLVIEAGEKSGTLITADFALEQGREVFAVPGSIFSIKSKGANRLITQGAKPVQDLNDMLEEFGLKPGATAGNAPKMQPVTIPELFGDEKIIYEKLGFEKKHIDNLAIESNIDVIKLSSMLTMMELKGIIKQTSGKNFLRAK